MGCPIGKRSLTIFRQGGKTSLKIQLALDRLSIEEAIEMGKKTQACVDILEVGTSLIKDYGLESLSRIRAAFPHKVILADLKTMDEGEYEFRAAFTHGADLATVMGAASIDTVKICYRVAEEYGRSVMIDLLETPKEKLEFLTCFPKAVFCLHTPKDSGIRELSQELKEFVHRYPQMRRLAVAGGIRLDDVPSLSAFPVEILVVGSAISQERDPEAAARRFWAAVGNEGVRHV